MKFTIRVDDFPLNTRHEKDVGLRLFREFYKVLSKYDIYFVLGVIPKLCDADDIRFLKDIHSTGKVDIALHGYEHIGSGCNDSEFKVMNDIEDRIRCGLDILDGLDVVSFIPPHNYFDSRTVDALVKNKIRYLIVVSGYGSLFDDRIVCINTDPDLCGKSYELIKKWGELKHDLDVVKNITLHCTWEYGTSLNNFELLCRDLSGKTVKFYEYRPKKIDFSFLPIGTKLSYQWIVSKVGSGNYILDVGSKDSLLPSILTGMCNSVVALDKDSISLSRQYNLMIKYGLDFSLVVGDARNLEFENDTFNVVTASHSVPVALDDDWKIVKEVYRVLKKGGRFYMVSAYTDRDSYYWMDRKDPMRVNNFDDILKRFVIPNGFMVGDIKFYKYDYGTNIGSYCSKEDANAICLELIK